MTGGLEVVWSGGCFFMIWTRFDRRLGRGISALLLRRVWI